MSGRRDERMEQGYVPRAVFVRSMRGSQIPPSPVAFCAEKLESCGWVPRLEWCLQFWVAQTSPPELHWSLRRGLVLI